MIRYFDLRMSKIMIKLEVICLMGFNFTNDWFTSNEFRQIANEGRTSRFPFGYRSWAIHVEFDASGVLNEMCEFRQMVGIDSKFIISVTELLWMEETMNRSHQFNEHLFKTSSKCLPFAQPNTCSPMTRFAFSLFDSFGYFIWRRVLQPRSPPYDDGILFLVYRHTTAVGLVQFGF